MENNFNTIALAYLNENGEVVGWSADTFGSPSNYPKTYKNSEANVKMLEKKCNNINTIIENSINFAKLLGKNNKVAQVIVEESINSNEIFFKNHKVVGGKIMQLELFTDYSKGKYLPIWEDVVNCIDNNKYHE